MSKIREPAGQMIDGLFPVKGFLLCLHMLEGDGKLPRASFKKALITCKMAPPS